MLAGMSSAEFTEWMAYDSIDPIGAERRDLGFGIVASTIANVHRKRGSRAFKPRDFMPDWRPKAERSRDLSERLKGFFSRFPRK